MSSPNRYANDWDQYSRQWEQEYGRKYRHVGDEWNDDATADRARDAYYFNIFADRFLRPGMTALEVGPGGGKWTVRLAPRVKRLIVLDVSREMLARTRKRCEEEGITNVEFVLSNGRDFQPVPDASVNFFFSYDVFVHIALEDTYPYTREMNRVLVDGGKGTCHYAINTVPEAWNRVEGLNDWYRGGQHTLGQYFYFSPESLRRMYEHCGLKIDEQHVENWHCTCIFQKTPGTIVPKLERLLGELIDPDAGPRRAEVLSALRALPAEVERAAAPLLDRAASAGDDHGARVRAADELRRLWRGVWLS